MMRTHDLFVKVDEAAANILAAEYKLKWVEFDPTVYVVKSNEDSVYLIKCSREEKEVERL